MAINPSSLFIAVAPCEISHMKIGLFYGLSPAKIVPGPPDLPEGPCHASAMPMWGDAIPTPILPHFSLLLASIFRALSHSQSFSSQWKDDEDC